MPGNEDADGAQPVGVMRIDNVTQPIPKADSTAARPHVHTRDGYWCPALVAPFVPTKKAAKYLVAYASAVLHEETFVAFVRQHPDEFPGVTSADPVDAEIVTVTR